MGTTSSVLSHVSVFQNELFKAPDIVSVNSGNVSVGLAPCLVLSKMGYAKLFVKSG